MWDIKKKVSWYPNDCEPHSRHLVCIDCQSNLAEVPQFDKETFEASVMEEAALYRNNISSITQTQIDKITKALTNKQKLKLALNEFYEETDGLYPKLRSMKGGEKC
ncbi:hypothetical protein HYW46_03085 [Candidatus Daviesbacteria bacterium]|nr:hypothetical protein [Candidatus Daviesbacteria bacterium]